MLQDPDDYTYWEEIFAKSYPGRNILNLTDPGEERVTSYEYLLSLNENNENLDDDELDLLLDKEDAHFLLINVSRLEPMITFHFWMYPKASQGQELVLSEKPFLKEHEIYEEKSQAMVDNYGLQRLYDKDLKAKTTFEGRTVSVFYKYFEQLLEDPFHLVFEDNYLKED